jgi:hypothetical protein
MNERARRRTTEAELLQMPQDGRKYELVDGEIRASPGGTRHGLITVALASRLLAYADRSRLGYVFDSRTGFRLPKGNVRSPDVSFVARGGFPGEVIPVPYGRTWQSRSCRPRTVPGSCSRKSVNISTPVCGWSGSSTRTECETPRSTDRFPISSPLRPMSAAGGPSSTGSAPPIVLMERLLALNPGDNHGVRTELVTHYLETGQEERVLRVTSQFEEDLFAEVRYGRILALRRLGRKGEALSSGCGQALWG